MKRLVFSVLTSVILMSAVIFAGCGGAGGIKISFPGGSVLAIDQGQSITINATTTNDGGDGVTWTCTGAACTTLASATITSVQFSASGATGTATITATSIKNTSDSQSVTITVSAPPTITTTQTQLNGTASVAGQSYNFSFTATGGAGTLTWSATGLGDGLSINSSTGAITGTPTTAQTISFTVKVTDSSAAGDQSYTTATLTITVTPAPVLSITKSHIGNFNLGQQNAAYTVTVSNAVGAGSTAGTVTVTEAVPSGLTLVSMAGTGWTCTGTTCTRSDALAAGSSYPPITVTVNVSATATSPQTNHVSVSGGESATANGSDSTTILVPVLSITKTHTGNFTQGQQNAAYTVTVSNMGSAPTVGTVTVTETAPSGETLVSMAGTGWTCTGTTCTRSDALGTASSYPAITVTVNVSATAPTPQNNQVAVSGGGSVGANTSDSTIIVEPVLSITKTHIGDFTQGEQNATYTVTVSNTTGTAPTSGTVTVTETAPSGETLVSMAGTGWTCTGTTCTRSDALGIGLSYPAITVTVNVSATAPTPQNNQVAVSGGGSVGANTSDSTIIVEPVLSITKTHSGNFAVSQQNATYTVTVTNNGTAPTDGTTVEVTDTIPSGETLVSMAGTGWTCPGGGGADTCDRSDVLGIGLSYAQITVTVNVAANAGTPQVNQVSVSGGGSATANGSDSTTITGGVSCNSGSESLLSGQYAFLLQGFDTNGPIALIGSFTADGAGHITAGEEDLNNSTTASTPPALSITTASSSYSVGLDTNGGYRGCMTIATSAATSTYRFVLNQITSNVAFSGRMIEFDSTGTNAAGVMYQQTASAFSNSQVTGHYAFGGSSTSSLTQQSRFAIAGTFNVSGTTISSGEFDADQVKNGGGPNAENSTFTGTRGTPDGNGRTTFTLTPTGGSAGDFVYYIISASDLLEMSNDAQSSNLALQAGAAMQQTGGGSFSNSSLSGTSVIYFTGLDNSGGTPIADVQVGLLSIPSSGNFTFSTDENDGGTISTPSTNNGSGTYSVASNGRVTLTAGGGNHPPVFYLVSAGKGFVVDTGGEAMTGFFTPQSSPGSYSNASASGVFGFGTFWPAEQNIGYNTGWAGFSGSGTVLGTSDDVSLGNGQDVNQGFSQDYAVTSNGRGIVYSSGQSSTPQQVFYMVSSTKAILMDAYGDSGNPTTDPALAEGDHQ
jgi:uncharacterized repeat protein (TIGR01451 family)